MSIVTIKFTKNCLHTGPPIQGTATTYLYHFSNDLNRPEKPFQFGDKLYSQFLFINFKTINNILIAKIQILS